MSSQLVSPILKPPDSEKRIGLKVRFDMNSSWSEENISEAILDYIHGLDATRYIKILNCLTKEKIGSDILCTWLKELCENISIITPQCEGLIISLLKSRWTDDEENVIKTFESFILVLLSAHPHYLKMILKSLMDRLVPCSTTNEFNAAIPPYMIGNINAEEKRKYFYVHRILKAVITLVPLAPVALIPILTNSFPYMMKSGHHQACYFYNVLSITLYMPDLRKTILEIVVDKMIKIDVHCPKQTILDAESEETDNDTAEQELNDDTIFKMDEAVEDSKNEESDGSKLAMSHELGNLLDVMMDTLLSYIHDVCYVNDELDWDSTKKLYKELLFIFNKLILPTHASCHIQFIMFYICSFRSALCEGFLDYLWKRVTDPNTPPILRQSAVSYFGSYLARATYISVNTVATCLQIMLGWLHRYIVSQEGRERSFPDISLHGPFYSVCQASFYVFAFRHKELLEMPQGYSILKSLNFDRIVASPLNPLRFCLPAVVRNFATVARNYQLAYCFTIIERNNRVALQIVSRNPAHAILSTKNALDSFFPFDPFVLVRSSKRISPIYREYQGPLEDEQPEKIESYDNILQSGCSLSPSKLIGSPSTLPEFLLHGSSPGFKHSLLINSVMDLT